MTFLKFLRGKAANLANKVFHDGYAYFTPDDGAFYIDAETDGEQKRIRVNPDDYIIEQNAKEKQKIWRGSKEEYDAITTKDANTLYIVTDEDGSSSTGGGVNSVNGKTGAVVLDSSDVGAVAASNVTQSLGSSADKVPSEKAVSDAMTHLAPTDIGALPGVKVYGKADANGKIMAYTDAACTQEADFRLEMAISDYGNALLIYDHKTYQFVGFEKPASAQGSGSYSVTVFSRTDVQKDASGKTVFTVETARMGIMEYLSGSIDAPIKIETYTVTDIGEVEME